MLTLLPEPISFSVKKRTRSITAVHHTPIEGSHCSPQTTNTFSPSFTQSLLSLMLVIGLFANLVRTTCNSLGRRIQTISGGDTINYYYDPEVEFLELGHEVNGSCTWNLYGPDRSGTYGGAQGIGGLESSYDENSNTSKQWVNNYFGDSLGWYDSIDQSFSANLMAFGAYGPMPGSPNPKNFNYQWRGHYVDETGLYYMGTRYYDPINAHFLSPDPLGHSSSLGLYDYCNGDRSMGLDPDGRCMEKVGAAGIATASFFMGGPGSYTGIDYGTDQLHLTDTSKFSPEELLEYNRNVATLSGAAQDATFALAGAVTPYNQISYEPMRFEIGAGEPAVTETLEVGGVLRKPGLIPPKLYHYTLEKYAEGIVNNGLDLRSGKIFATVNSTLSPLQAQIELGLKPNRGLPTALFEIDAEGLGAAGRRPAFGPVRVQPIPTSPGGAEEIIYEKEIPPQFLKRIR